MIASTSPDLCRKESSIVYWKVEDSGKNAEDEAPDRMLPWVIDFLDFLKRLPRRLCSDGEEFVFLTLEGRDWVVVQAGFEPEARPSPNTPRVRRPFRAIQANRATREFVPNDSAETLQMSESRLRREAESHTYWPLLK